MIFQGRACYPVNEIILHCADTRPDWMDGHPLVEKVAEIHVWHVQQRGWRDIGYHSIIDRDGAVAAGRKEIEIGAHVEGHNRGTIGICLLGGYGAEPDDEFERNFTRAQAVAARRLIGAFKVRAANQKVSGHKDYAAKACAAFRPPVSALGKSSSMNL